MTLDQLSNVLLWSAIVNYVVLSIWWLVLLTARDWMYRLHTRWFQLTHQQFDHAHYCAIAFYKLAIFLLFLGPWIALQMVD